MPADRATCYGAGASPIGHVTKLSAIDGEDARVIACRLADAGVAVTVLPATDLFLMGRGHEHSSRAASRPRTGCWRTA